MGSKKARNLEKELIKLINFCKKEIKKQHKIFKKMTSSSKNYAELKLITSQKHAEFFAFLIQQNILSKQLQEQIEINKILKKDIMAVEEEMRKSSYITDIAIDMFLERLIEKEANKYDMKMAKILTSSQIKEHRELKKKLKEEESKSIKLEKMCEDIKKLQARKREIDDTREAKQNHQAMLKNTYQNISERREELQKEKEALLMKIFKKHIESSISDCNSISISISDSDSDDSDSDSDSNSNSDSDADSNSDSKSNSNSDSK